MMFITGSRCLISFFWNVVGGEGGGRGGWWNTDKIPSGAHPGGLARVIHSAGTLRRVVAVAATHWSLSCGKELSCA